jgi:hypothetical protein
MNVDLHAHVSPLGALQHHGNFDYGVAKLVVGISKLTVTSQIRIRPGLGPTAYWPRLAETKYDGEDVGRKRDVVNMQSLCQFS